MTRFENLLCATDFSQQALRALEAALEVASEKAHLTLLHVYPPPGLLLPEGFVAATPQTYRELIEAIDRSLEELRTRAARTGLTITPIAVQGHAASEICRVAREGHHDLIVVGTHGRTGIARFMLGSVAEHVLRDAPCPVLVVRPVSEPTAHAA